MTAEEVDRREKDSFLLWRREIAVLNLLFLSSFFSSFHYGPFIDAGDFK